MTSRQDNLRSDDDKIVDVLNETLSDIEVVSDISDGLEESDHDTNSELYGDDTDEDPDYIPTPEQLSDTDNELRQEPATTCAETDNNSHPRQEPVIEGAETRVAPGCIVGRRNKDMIKKKLPGFKWSVDPPPMSRTRAHNIVTKLPGIVGPARVNKPDNPLDSWRLFIDSTMIDEILEWTNEKITELASNYGKKTLDCHHVDHVDKAELEAFFGLLYLAGVFKSNHEDVSSLFATDGTGRDIFRCTMSKNRFLFLLSALRFDCISTRDERKKSDELAAISEVFNRFVANSQMNYSCGQYTTVDEMLVGFRGRFKYRVYMKSKPAKYGVKIFILTDARTSYFVNGSIYCATQYRNPKKLLKPTLEVMNLVQPIVKSNRNVTGDNYFSSVELVDELKENGLTYVGTLRKNKLEIPESFLPDKHRPAFSSKFAFTADKTLVSYVPKPNQAVVLISSMHHDNNILENREDLKPEIIDFYNTTKIGVDVLDQKCAHYSVGRRTQRWPMVVWYALMDIAGVNSNIVYQAANPNSKSSRRNFLVSLGRSLTENQLKKRIQNASLLRELKMTIRRICAMEEEPPAANQEAPRPKRQRCYLCPRNRDQKHSNFCVRCFKGVCKQLSKQDIVCDSCKDQERYLQENYFKIKKNSKSIFTFIVSPNMILQAVFFFAGGKISP